jgi:hypothetical protein
VSQPESPPKTNRIAKSEIPCEYEERNRKATLVKRVHIESQ